MTRSKSNISNIRQGIHNFPGSHTRHGLHVQLSLRNWENPLALEPVFIITIHMLIHILGDLFNACFPFLGIRCSFTVSFGDGLLEKLVQQGLHSANFSMHSARYGLLNQHILDHGFAIHDSLGIPHLLVNQMICKFFN